jgi:hypothetical protein
MPEPMPAPSPASEPRRALVSRSADFWLLGGASIAVWLAMLVADAFRTRPAVDERLGLLGAFALSLSLVANYPHFLFSYKLAYTRGRGFVSAHWWQLIAVPLALISLLGVAFLFYQVPVANLPWTAPAVGALAAFGRNAQVISGPRFGDLLLGLTFNLMILTIGWHYTKQVFGCMMVYAHFDRYPLAPAQRRTLKWALLAMWALVFVDNNRSGAWRAHLTFSYSSLDLPDVAAPLAGVVVAGGLAAAGWRVFYANYAAGGRLPSANFLVPMAALYVWWLPLTRQAEFYFFMAPLFHAVQYLPFVYRIEDSRRRATGSGHAALVAMVAGVLLAGWLAFETVPGAADAALDTLQRLGISFFVIAAMLFINIHHYFIDNVIWRFGDPEIRAHLLEGPQEGGGLQAPGSRLETSALG